MMQRIEVSTIKRWPVIAFLIACLLFPSSLNGGGYSDALTLGQGPFRMTVSGYEDGITGFYPVPTREATTVNL